MHMGFTRIYSGSSSTAITACGIRGLDCVDRSHNTDEGAGEAIQLLNRVPADQQTNRGGVHRMNLAHDWPICLLVIAFAVLGTLAQNRLVKRSGEKPVRKYAVIVRISSVTLYTLWIVISVAG